MKNIVQGSLITTFRCNAKCNMCNIWKHQTKPTEEIDPSYYEKLPAGLRINITGGEATIRKDIDRIFEILSQVIIIGIEHQRLQHRKNRGVSQ